MKTLRLKPKSTAEIHKQKTFIHGDRNKTNVYIKKCTSIRPTRWWSMLFNRLFTGAFIVGGLKGLARQYGQSLINRSLKLNCKCS